ncbi:MAG TPA: hypothetical protein VGF28_06725 [Thermoanaerobaculia bacterium]
MTESRRHDLAAIGLIAAVITILFIDVVIGTGVFYTRDVGLYHFPLRTVLRTIVENGEFPYWNPFISAGQPLAANPAHELFYPLTWLVMLPDFIYGFNWHALIHIYLAAFGMYAFLRSLGTLRAAAGIGGLSFALGGFMLSGLNLFPFLFSAAWLPLTCLFLRRFLSDHAPRDFALASLSLGMQFLVGEPVTIMQTGLVLGLYALSRPSRVRDVAAVAAVSVAALLVSAVQILPGIDHARDSVRAKGFTFESVSEWSTPPVRMIEAVYPDVFGSARIDGEKPYYGAHLYPGRGVPLFLSVYSGLLIVVAAFAGVASRVRGYLLYLSIVLLSLLLAFGSHAPLLRLLYDLGLLRSVRFPEKFLMIATFATVAFGAVALDQLLRGNARVRNAAIAIAALTAIVGVVLYTPLDLARGLVLAALLFLATRTRTVVAAALLGAFVLSDLAPRAGELAPRAPRAFYTSPPTVLRQLRGDHHDYRLFHIGNWSQRGRNRRDYLSETRNRSLVARNALLGLAPATYGVRGAMNLDFDLTALRASDELARAAWDLHEIFPRWLDYVTAMSNVRYVAIFRPAAQAVAEAGGDARLLEPIRIVEGLPHPRYYFATALATARDRKELVTRIASGRYGIRTAFVPDEPFQPAAGRVLRSAESANRVRMEVEAAGTAFLVMSVTAHKYWTVTIDGVEVQPVSTNLAYQGVVVPRGRHVVEMRYRNPLVAAGGAISAATLLALLFAGWRRRPAITMRDL